MTDKPLTWNDVRDSARNSLVEGIEYRKSAGDDLASLLEQGDLYDDIHETADTCTPVYNHDIMTVASHPDVWTQDCSDFGEARDLI